MAKFEEAYKLLPSAPGSGRAEGLLTRVRTESSDYLRDFARHSEAIQSWDHKKPFGWFKSVSAFFFGKEWVTNSSWHDFFGLLPLLSGSLIISIIALVVAVPFSVGAAIYVNQLANPWEQSIVKPAIEFVQAIPSVVLGFFGISFWT